MMAERVYVVVEPMSYLARLMKAALWVPALTPPGYIFYRTWIFLDQLHWHPVFMLLSEFVVLILMGFIIAIIGLIPKIIACPIGAIYMAFTYGAASMWWLELDQIWTGAIALVAAAVGGAFAYSWHETKEVRQFRELLFSGRSGTEQGNTTKNTLGLGLAVAAATLLVVIIYIYLNKSSPTQPEAAAVSTSEAPGSTPYAALTNIPPPPPPPQAPDTGPLPSINQPFRFWSDAERHGRMDTRLPVKRYIFDLAMNHRIPVKNASAVLGEIIVPGDVSGVDWDVTNITQQARLTENGAAVTLTPSMLQELRFRRDRLLALGVPR